MKAKYLIIAILIVLLGFTVKSMLRIEDRIRSEKITYVEVIDTDKPLFASLNPDELQKIAEECDYYFIAEGSYFKVLNPVSNFNKKEKVWEPVFFRGVNIGTAVPGKFPTEFSLSFDEYLNWFRLIGEMNANVIRVYTVLPPEFYQALITYNLRNYSKKLYLFQGVWTELPAEGNFYNAEFTRKFKEEIIKVVDILHGKAVLPEKKGHASGIYSANISNYVAGILLGREWEPNAVEKTNRLNDKSSFNGNFISVHHGNAMEVWLGEMMDFTIQYETQTYQAQRPVSFVNWLPLDPMHHQAEFIEAEYIREYDNDLESLDFNHFHSTNLFKPNIFASYHVYPYYPDFIYNDDKYANQDEDNFYYYLKDLKEMYAGMPLLISEYGIPSSRGNSHYTPHGFDQGGHSEKEQSEMSVKLSRDVFSTGCAGAIYFEWIDEWFKQNWLVMDFEQPAENRRLWHNMENPEQNYGILAYENKSKVIDGKESDWPGFNPKDKIQVQFDSDPTYFYFLAFLKDFDFKKNKLFVAIDVFDKEKGDHKLPFSDMKQELGFEFLAEFSDESNAELLVDDFYSIFTDRGERIVPTYTSVPNNNGIFVNQYVLANRKRESVTGKIYPEIRHNRGSLVFGNSSNPATSNSDWYWNAKSKILEVRFTWSILNITDPSTHSVLDNKEGTKEIEISVTDGFNLVYFITDRDNKVLYVYPPDNALKYKWKEWYEPEYQSRIKPVYYALQKEFRNYNIINDNTESVGNSEEFIITPLKDNSKGAVSFIINDFEKQNLANVLSTFETFNTKAAFIVEENKKNPETLISTSLSSASLKLIDSFDNEIIFSAENSDLQDEYFLHDLKNKKITTTDGTGLGFDAIWINDKEIDPPDITFWDKSGCSTFLMGNKVFTSNNDFDIKLLNTLPDYQKLDSILQKTNGWFVVPVSKTSTPDPENSLNEGNISFEQLHRIIRIFRNDGYWITTPSEIALYIELTEGSLIKTNRHKNITYVTISTKPGIEAGETVLTLIYKSSAKKIKVTNSADDGIYNLRSGKVILSVYPNKEASIEIIEP